MICYVLLCKGSPFILLPKRDRCYKFAFVSKQICKAFSGVKYALDVIFVTINIIQLIMLFNQILRWKIGLWGWKKLPKAGLSLKKYWTRGFGACKSAAVLLQTQRKQAQMIRISKYKYTVLNRMKTNPASIHQKTISPIESSMGTTNEQL